jgi:CBS domain-containing protein
MPMKNHSLAMSNSSEKSAPKKLEDVVVEKTGALSPTDSIQTAGERMRAVEANAWPVVEDRKLVGVIDHSDPDRHAGGHGHDPNATRVGDTMRHDADFCYTDQSAADADRIMRERDINHLPVVDREMKIVGIISREDVKSAEGDWQPGEGHAAKVTGEESAEKPGESPEVGGEAVDQDRLPFRESADGAESR